MTGEKERHMGGRHIAVAIRPQGAPLGAHRGPLGPFLTPTLPFLFLGSGPGAQSAIAPSQPSSSFLP